MKIVEAKENKNKRREEKRKKIHVKKLSSTTAKAIFNLRNPPSWAIVTVAPLDSHFFPSLSCLGGTMVGCCEHSLLK